MLTGPNSAAGKAPDSSSFSPCERCGASRRIIAVAAGENALDRHPNHNHGTPSEGIDYLRPALGGPGKPFSFNGLENRYVEVYSCHFPEPTNGITVVPG